MMKNKLAIHFIICSLSLPLGLQGTKRFAILCARASSMEIEFESEFECQHSIVPAAAPAKFNSDFALLCKMENATKSNSLSECTGCNSAHYFRWHFIRCGWLLPHCQQSWMVAAAGSHYIIPPFLSSFIHSSIRLRLCDTGGYKIYGENERQKVNSMWHFVVTRKCGKSNWDALAANRTENGIGKIRRN